MKAAIGRAFCDSCETSCVCVYARQARSIPGSDRRSAWGSRARTRSPGSRAPVDSLTHWLLTGLPLTSKSEPSKSCLWYLRYRSYKPRTITMRGRWVWNVLKRSIVGTHAFRCTPPTKAQAARGRTETGPTPMMNSSLVITVSVADESSFREDDHCAA